MLSVCSGALQVHQAADGGLARIRLAGGMVTAPQLEALAHAAAEFGSPAMELTSRGNIQVRGIHDEAGLAAAVDAAGLLPSATHERVRNIVASPLSGRSGGLGDIRAVVHGLDSGLQKRPDLAELSGRFWFGVDDGRGDISGLAPDVSTHLMSRDTAAVLVAGRDTGVRIPATQAAETLLNLAHTFLSVRGNRWRTGELDNADELLTGAGLRPTEPSGATATPTGTSRPSASTSVPRDSRRRSRATLSAAMLATVVTSAATAQEVTLRAIAAFAEQTHYTKTFLQFIERVNGAGGVNACRPHRSGVSTSARG